MIPFGIRLLATGVDALLIQTRKESIKSLGNVGILSENQVKKYLMLAADNQKQLVAEGAISIIPVGKLVMKAPKIAAFIGGVVGVTFGFPPDAEAGIKFKILNKASRKAAALEAAKSDASASPAQRLRALT
jgi:hypothetical protein